MTIGITNIGIQFQCQTSILFKELMKNSILLIEWQSLTELRGIC